MVRVEDLSDTNILTICFRGDLHNLLYQAYSLRKNWLSRKKWILIIEDSHKTSATKEFILKEIIPIMEGWEVQLIDNINIICRNGWYRQQIFKLHGVAQISDSKWTLVLDAKNFLINPLSVEWFNDNGLMKVQMHSDNVEDSWQTSLMFFGKDSKNHSRCYSLTPWMMNKQITRFVIDEFEKRQVDIYKTPSLPAWEFYAYWIFAEHRYAYTSSKLSSGINATGVDMAYLNWYLRGKNYTDHPFFAYHRYHIRNEYLRKNVNKFLMELGIVDEFVVKKFTRTANLIMKKFPETYPTSSFLRSICLKNFPVYGIEGMFPEKRINRGKKNDLAENSLKQKIEDGLKNTQLESQHRSVSFSSTNKFVGKKKFKLIKF
jgi:hypothetical protein